MTTKALEVPLIDLSPQYAPIREAVQAVWGQLASMGTFTFGEEVTAFEAEFAAYCGARQCVGVGSGTDALWLALRAMGVGPGSDVITVPNTFVATVEAIALTGARPVFVDVDPHTRCMDPEHLRAALGARTAAVVPVHLYGRPAPMPEIVDICERAGVPVLEDAAQAHGAAIAGRRVGTWGTVAAFSFYPTKNLGAMGDGGAVVCNRSDLADLVRSMRHHGCAPNECNEHVRPGTTSRLDSLQAAVLRLKLPLLDGWNSDRRRIARLYRDELSGLPLELPDGDGLEVTACYHQFVIELDNRDHVLADLHAKGIGAGVHYPTPVHLQPAWRALGGSPGDHPVAEKAATRILSLPIFPGLTDAEMEAVVAALGRVLG